MCFNKAIRKNMRIQRRKINDLELATKDDQLNLEQI